MVNKAQTEKVSQKQTIQKVDMLNKNSSFKQTQEILITNDWNVDTKIKLNTTSTTPTQKLIIEQVKVSKESPSDLISNNDPKLLQERKQFLSFGILAGNEKVEKRRESEQKIEDAKIVCKSSERKPKIKEKTKGEEEDANLSLVSYEETEVGDEKYYNEEELTKILAWTQTNKSNKKKTEDSKRSKSKNTFNML